MQAAWGLGNAIGFSFFLLFLKFYRDQYKAKVHPLRDLGSHCLLPWSGLWLLHTNGACDDGRQVWRSDVARQCGTG